MFAQFFGSFLLNEGFVTGEQLAKAFVDKKNTRMKLGVLAIEAGLMTAKQVEQVHQEQARVDKRIGDLAVDMGFLKPEDVERLLSAQPADYLILGQTLVNNGVLSNSQFENAINSYKTKHALTDEDIAEHSDHLPARLILDFYHFEDEEFANTYIYYLDLLFKNLIRFIGDDFSLLPAKVVSEYKADCMAVQDVSGSISCRTGIEAGVQQYVNFAGRFAQEELSEMDEYANAAVGEFLNLNNGLFTVNISNEINVELKLDPQEYMHNETITYQNPAFIVPVSYSFGVVNFVISV